MMSFIDGGPSLYVTRIVICLPTGSAALCPKTMPNAVIYGKEKSLARSWHQLSIANRLQR
jgi:hypothetical protein